MTVTAIRCGALVCALAASVWADDPFVGKWKFDQAKSKIAGEQLQFEEMGDSLKVTFGDITDTVKMDGTDQPVHFGRTECITKEGANKLKVVTKQNGKVVDTLVDTLSSDGQTITAAGESVRPDGSKSPYTVSVKRVGSGSGWTGTWESTSVDIQAPDVFEIKPYGSDGLTFYTAAMQDTLNLKLDGSDAVEQGPTVPKGATSSGRRVDAHTLEITDKLQGSVRDHVRYTVQGDTLTEEMRETGQPSALRFVFDRVR